MKIFRKHFMIPVIIIALILAGCSYTIFINRQNNISAVSLDESEPKIKSGRDINFFVTTDIHYLATDLTDGGQAFKEFVQGGDGKQLGYINQLLDAFTSEIQRSKPDILIISGDLTNNGEKKSHLELAQKLEKIKNMGTSVFVIPGNHDIFNPYARGFKGKDQYKADYISDKDFSNIYGDFGYNDAISRDKNTLSYLTAPSEDIWLLMLDTAQYSNNLAKGTPQVDGRITDETYEWMKKCSELAKEKGVKIITVMHHNLMDHSNVIRDGFTINNGKEALNKFQSFELNLVLSGHVHIQSIRSLEKNNTQIYDIANSSLSVYPQQYGILKYSPSSGYDYVTTQLDMEDWSKKSGISDKNLNNFKEYSKETFADRSLRMAYSGLASLEGYSDEQKTLMAETLSKLNEKHFDGTKNVGMDEIRNSEGFKLWEDAPQGFIRNLVLSLSNDGDEDNNRLHIPLSNIK